MSTEEDQATLDTSTDGKPPERSTEKTLRAVCGTCGLIGFGLGLVVASLTEIVTYANEGEQRITGMFTALTLLAMGVLIPNPRVRGYAWLTITLYACVLLLALLVVGRWTNSP